ncbi:MAG: fatty acid kinase fatty acid binding subunit [Clostridia bacterium]|nr:fatty acid kinase fatty acid binding subunit [Clostridia bacterium]
MAEIRLVTDSTADLPQELVERYGITVVPLKVNFGEETYRDGIDMPGEEFYERLRNASALPTTSQPSPAEFVEAYNPLAEEGAEILSIHISSALSGTVQSAKLAASMLKYPDIEVVDSYGVSVYLGAMVLEAARAIEKGYSKEEILKLWQSFHSRQRLYFTVDSLEHLQKGGRIGKATAFLGTLLNIKPLLMIKDGGVFPYEKVRGRKKAFKRMVEAARKEFGDGTPLHIFAVHGDVPEYLTELRQLIVENLNCTELLTSRVGPVVGTHAGPSVCGFICWRDPENLE